MTLKRIQKILQDLGSDPVDNFSAGLRGDDMSTSQATIFGPQDSSHNKGVFFLNILVPSVPTSNRLQGNFHDTDLPRFR